MEATIINLYASNAIFEQIIFCGDPIELRKQFISPWIMGEDFNAVTNRSERSKCVGTEYGSGEFCSFIDSCKMVDLSRDFGIKYLIGRR